MENLQGGSLILEHRYDLIELVAEDGPLSHYLGVQDPFGRPVWVHVYALDRAEQDAPALIERLRTSAARLGAVRADGVLRPLDFGELDALTPFVVTERVELPTLLDLLDEQGTLTPAQLLTLIERLAPGLDALHDAGLVHGAIDPSTIFTSPDRMDQAQLGMPGVTLSVADLELLGAAPAPSQAPELLIDPLQVSDPSADIWALGRLMYLCLVGVDPAMETQHQPLDALGVEPAIAQVIACAMDPVPEQRWSSCGELADALRAACAPPAPPPAVVAPVPAASEPPVRPVRKVRVVASEQDELPPAQPNKLGTFALIACLALIVSNLGWLAWALRPPQADAAPGVAHTILPSGAKLATDPPGATVRITSPEQRALGQTPLQLPATTPDGTTLQLEAPGHRPARLKIQSGDNGQEVLIQLDRLD
jgi:hypothetical protein